MDKQEQAGGAGSAASDFYVDDVDFTSGYVHRLSPVVMDYVARFRGARDVHDREPQASFSYCELACGDGSTTNALAALFPESEFVAVDFNRGHIEDAEAAASEMGLPNVRFICCSFENLDEHELGQFDYIGINGAYGWLTPSLRGDVRAFVGAHLRAGGLFAVEYISLPGKAAVEPMWKMVQKLVPTENYDSSQARGRAGIKLLNGFNAANPNVFKAHPSTKNATKRYLGQVKSSQGNVDHFVHNALAGGFDARYFSDVYDEMALEGLSYAGRVDNLAQNDESFAMGPARFRLLEQYKGPRERELLKDFLLNTDVRCDLYLKASEQPAIDQSAAAFEHLYGFTYLTAEMLAEKPYRQLFSSEEVAFVVALDGTRPIGELLAETESSRGQLSLLNRLLDSGEVQMATQPWTTPPAEYEAVKLNGGAHQFYLQKSFKRNSGGSLPVPGLLGAYRLGAVELALLMMLVELGKTAALSLLEQRIGATTELLPGSFVESALRRKKPKPLFEQAQEFYSGEKIETLLRCGVLIEQ